MVQRLASATAVASVLIALAAGGLRLAPVPDLESRHLLTSVWCVVPLAWGVWAMLTPKSWLPQRMPIWGAILGALAGMLAVFVWDLPSRFAGEPVSTWVRGVGLLVAIGGYYLLWLVVRRTYRVLSIVSPMV